MRLPSRLRSSLGCLVVPDRRLFEAAGDQRDETADSTNPDGPLRDGDDLARFDQGRGRADDLGAG